VWTSRWVQTFWKNILPPSSTLEAAFSYEMLAPIYSPHGVKIEKTTMDIFTTVRTSNLMYFKSDHDHFLTYLS
jgi:hypothetical protein